MLKNLTSLLCLFFLLPIVNFSQTQRVKYQLEFGDVLSVYTDFNQIKPVLYNKSEKSIYLSSLYPRASARLLRFSDEKQEWESGFWASSYCSSIEGAEKPIEIIAGGSFKPLVYWQYSVDDAEKPKFFQTNDPENRPLKGKYRFSLAYAKEPFIYGKFPKIIYSVKSPEFFLEP